MKHQFIATASLILFYLIGFSQVNNLLLQSQHCGDIIWDKEYRGDGSIVKEIRPYNYQLYPRNSANTGFVKLSGRISNAGALTIKVLKYDYYGNKSLFASYNLVLIQNRFSVNIPINAELSEYSFMYSFDDKTWDTIAQHVECGDVYLISGQSNAITAYLGSQEIDSLVNTYGAKTNYGRFSRTYGDIWKSKGPWHISSVTGASQPVSFTVGAWGLVLQYNISKQFGIPTCLINGAIGGTNISEHLPPENGPFFHHDSMSNSNHYFRHLNTRVYEAGVEKDIKGIFWWQGDGGQDGPSPKAYLARFTLLYNYWLQYFPNFKHTYIIQVSSYAVNNPSLAYTSEDQRIMPTEFPNCRVMAANNIGPHRTEKGSTIHFQAVSYVELAERLTVMAGADIYDSPAVDFVSPNINHVFLHNDTVTITFNQKISNSFSDDLSLVTQAIRFDKKFVTITNPQIKDYNFEFQVSDTTITKISYLGILPGTDTEIPCYLKNQNKLAVLSFNDYPISIEP